MFGFIKGIFKFVIFLAVVVLLVLGYMGFVPGLSALFGADKPRDLGVVYASEDFDSFVKKTGVKFETLPPDTTGADSLRFSGVKAIDISFSSAEITANLNQKKWKYYPVSQTQVKINEDGTVEVSGVLRTDRLAQYAAVQGFSAEDQNTLDKYLKYFPSNPPFYVRGTVEVRDNQVTLNISEARLGRLAAPQSLLGRDEVISAVEDFIEDRINFVPNLHLDVLNFGGGNMNVDGTYPGVQAHAKEN
ncbi:MAG: hypothetical protein UX81_C0027G0002 [Parcubacteria group bacterium GW2011_GWA2_47_12]|nr:MAG: hypothetical protein UX81_C0027G0002 [Parcubacteria group bacterium GW2011_GWA2_47_12]